MKANRMLAAYRATVSPDRALLARSSVPSRAHRHARPVRTPVPARSWSPIVATAPARTWIAPTTYDDQRRPPPHRVRRRRREGLPGGTHRGLSGLGVRVRASVHAQALLRARGSVPESAKQPAASPSQPSAEGPAHEHTRPGPGHPGQDPDALEMPGKMIDEQDRADDEPGDQPGVITVAVCRLSTCTRPPSCRSR